MASRLILFAFSILVFAPALSGADETSTASLCLNIEAQDMDPGRIRALVFVDTTMVQFTAYFARESAGEYAALDGSHLSLDPQNNQFAARFTDGIVISGTLNADARHSKFVSESTGGPYQCFRGEARF